MKLIRKIIHDIAYWKHFSFFNSRFSPCRTITERLSIPEQTTFLQKMEIHFHLFVCDVCRAFLTQTEWMKKTVKSMVHKTTDDPPISELNKKIIEKFSKK